MADPLGLINVGGGSPMQRLPGRNPGSAPGAPGGADFGQMLRKEIAQVNALQQESTQAMEDLGTGARHDVEGVILATQKAEMAFKMLLQVRNKVMDAYDEVKQIRI